MRYFWAALLLIGCGGKQDAKTAADTLAKVANVAATELVRMHADEIMSCVDRSETLAESKTCRAGVDTKWAPVVKAWEKMQAALTENAYCDLRDVAPIKMVDIGCGR